MFLWGRLRHHRCEIHKTINIPYQSDLAIGKVDLSKKT